MNFKSYFSIGFTILVIETITCHVNGANILAFLPVPAKSHMYIYKSLLEELSKRNHTVTAVVSIPQEISSPNYKEIVVESSGLAELKNHDFFPENDDVQTFGKAEVWQLGYTLCEDGFKNPEFQKLIESVSTKRKKFDLIINEIPFYQFSVAALGYIFDAPMIGLSSHGYTNLDEEFSGEPSYLPYDPDLSLPYGTKMTFLQRLHNNWFKLKSNMLNYIYNLPKHEELLKKYFKNHYRNLPPLTVMLKNISLHLINSHPCINPRPYNPRTIEVGGIHINSNEKQTLPQDLQKFMDAATEGVIYFSFGSNIPTQKMPKHKLDVFIKIFSNIKQKILWKVHLNDTRSVGLPKNILIKEWVPQKSVLAHKNCLLFITHGGLLSIEEAIWYGVPLLGIPFFGDQPMNMERVNEAGFGIRIEYNNISLASLSWALNEILNKPSYREAVKKYSEVFRDYPHSPLDKAVYWTEYVIRHKGTPYFAPAGNFMTWYQYYSFDIYICVIFIFILLFSVILISLKYLVYQCFISFNNVKLFGDLNKIKTN